MKKKILNFILLILLATTLVSCDIFKLNKDKKKGDDIFVDYETTSVHEKLIMDNYELIKDTTVSLVNKNNPKIGVGSAVIYKSVKDGSSNVFYALTSAEILTKNLNNLSILISKGALSEKIIAYAYNENNNIAIIKFKSSKKLQVAQFLEKDFLKIDVGQNITTIGTTSNLDDFLTFKTGMVTNIIAKNKFIHDAASNAGEIGAGIFSLEGKLIGINIEKVTKIAGENYNVFGINIAFNIAAIAQNLMEIEVDGKNITISDDKFNNSFLTNENKYSDYEKEIRNIYNNEKIKNSVVSINYNNIQTSGIVYEKIHDKKYRILTVNRNLDGNNISLEIGNKNFYQSNIEKISTIELKISQGAMIIEVEFKEKPEIDFFEISAINNKKGIDLVEGQKLLTFGKITGVGDKLFFNQAVLSKKDVATDVFSHDGKINVGQEGSPIFNLKGELIGINAGKEDHVTTGNGSVVLEGMNYAFDINFLAPQINNPNSYDIKKLEVLIQDKYEANNEYEAKIISAIKKIYNSTVTVSVDSGHGSGIIYKKESTNKNTYIYSLLTNEHVVEKGVDITIGFNNTSNYVTAHEYRKNKDLDISVVKFESENEYDVLSVDALENKPLKKIKVGQIVIAVGTPRDTKFNGYVTVGNMIRNTSIYQKISDLGLSHDAAINPGNSGGPLINLNGDLIGINVSKITYIQSGKGNVLAERISSSLNINVLKNIVEEYNSQKFLKISMVPRLGVKITSLQDFLSTHPIFSDDRLFNALKEKNGIIILGIDEKRIAYKNLQENDVIIEIDGTKVSTINAMSAILGKIKIGDKHKFKFLRFKETGNFETIEKELIIK